MTESLEGVGRRIVYDPDVMFRLALALSQSNLIANRA